MSKFVNALYTYVRPIVKYMWLIIVIILFILIGVYAYNSFAKPYITKSPSSNIANTVNRSNSNNVDIYFFHVEWCPHCIKAMPEWQTFSNNTNGKVVNGYTVICHDIDCTNDSDPNIAQMVKDNGIDGYPTVRITFDDGTKINFDSNISANSLATFVTTVTSTK